MIIRETETEFICIHQHDHAQLSGWIAANWGNEQIPPLLEPKFPLILAASLHDVGWIPLDQKPVWNEEKKKPYSFMDEPLERKLSQYQKGVSRVEREDPYAALLCSLHYTSFFPYETRLKLGEPAITYVEKEQKRQKKLKAFLKKNGRLEELAKTQTDLSLLKLWDNISLYVALNQPSVPKENEHPWYKNGFSPIKLDKTKKQIKFNANWQNEREIRLSPFPFESSLPYSLPFRKLNKNKIKTQNFHTVYHGASVSVQVLIFVP